MPPLLYRPHHVFCTLTQRDAGYSTLFKKNFRDVAWHLEHVNPQVIFTFEADVLCRACTDDCGALPRDLRALQLLKRLFPDAVRANTGLEITPAFVKAARGVFWPEILTACTPCPWQKYCENIARQHFRACLLTAA